LASAPVWFAAFARPGRFAAIDLGWAGEHLHFGRRIDVMRASLEQPSKWMLNRREGATVADLLTKRETCEMLRCSSRTLDRWRSMWKARKMNPLGEVKIRKRACFRRDAVEKLFTTPKLWLQDS
jgi:hypothetical protein